jgi:hypothetical protein
MFIEQCHPVGNLFVGKHSAGLKHDSTKRTSIVIPKVRDLAKHELRRLAEQDASGMTRKDWVL